MASFITMRMSSKPMQASQKILQFSHQGLCNHPSPPSINSTYGLSRENTKILRRSYFARIPFFSQLNTTGSRPWHHNCQASLARWHLKKRGLLSTGSRLWDYGVRTKLPNFIALLNC
jgi:hypothetical protein